MWPGCVPRSRDFGKTLLWYFCTKARRILLWSSFNFDTKVCLQQRKPDSLPVPSYFSVYVWRQRISKPDRLRYVSLPASAGFVATCTSSSVLSYVTVCEWCLWRQNNFNFFSQTIRVREIPFLVSHATIRPFPYMSRLDTSRARPVAQSENIAIDNSID